MKDQPKKLYTESDLKLSERSYSTIKLMSVLIAGTALNTLLDSYLPKVLETHKLAKVAILLIFIVFCINIWTSGAISLHIFNVYHLMGGNKNLKGHHFKKKIATNEYQNKTQPFMDKTLDIFWISLPIFVIGVTIIITIRYQLHDNQNYLMMFYICGAITLFAFIYQRHSHRKKLNKVMRNVGVHTEINDP